MSGREAIHTICLQRLPPVDRHWRAAQHARPVWFELKDRVDKTITPIMTRTNWKYLTTTSFADEAQSLCPEHMVRIACGGYGSSG
jgi:hypothetical protein